MVSTAQQGVQSLQSIGSSLGSSNPFAPLMGSLNGVGQGLSIIQQNSGPAAEGLSNVAKAGGLMMGIGTGIAAVGAGLQNIAGPIQQSQNALNQVIKDNAAELEKNGASVQQTQSLYQGAGEAAARYGFNVGQTNDALSRLTAITGSAQESTKELTLAEIITTQTHSSLANATQMLGQAHGGMYRQFRQFGLDLPNVNASLADTTKATEAVTAADQKLSAAQQNLADYNQQLTEKLQAQKDAWATKVQAADQAAQDAESAYSQAVAAYSQKQQTDEANWAEAVQNASDAVATAKSNLNDLEARLAAEEADRAAQRQEEIENQNQSLEDAVTRRQQLLQRQAVAGPARTASEALSRQQALANATEEVQKQQEKLNDLTTKPLDTQTQQLDQQQQIQKATTAVNTAQDKLNDAVEKQKEGEAALAIQYGSVLKAQDIMNDAEQKAARVKQESLAAGQATSAELEKQRHLEEAVTKATEEDQKAKDNLTKAQQAQNELQTNFQKIEDFLTQKYGGVLEARRHTFQGWLDNMKADITDWVGTEGPKLAEIGIGLGSALAAGGGITRTISTALGGIKGIIQKTKGDTAGPIEELGGQMKLPGMAAEEMAGSAAEAAPGFIASIGSMMAVAAPIAAIVAAIGLVVVAGYEIVTHWKEISSDIVKGWGVIENFAKQIWGDITGFFRRFWPELLAIFTGGASLIIQFVIQHWTDIENTAKEIWGDITGFFRRFWPELLVIFTGGASLIVKFVIDHWTDIKRIFSGGVNDVLNFFRNLPTEIKRLFGDAIHWLEDAGSDVLHGLANGLLRAAEDTIGHVPIIGGQIVGALKDALGVHSPSTITHQMGVDFIQGLINGVDSAHGGLLDKLQNVGQQAAQRTLQGLGTPTIGVGALGGVPTGYTTPGATPVSGSVGGGVTNLFTIKFDVSGNIVTEHDFFQQFRNWLIQQGLHSGGNYTGAGSSTV